VKALRGLFLLLLVIAPLVGPAAPCCAVAPVDECCAPDAACPTTTGGDCIVTTADFPAMTAPAAPHVEAAPGAAVLVAHALPASKPLDGDVAGRLAFHPPAPPGVLFLPLRI
jgi:hypothetical protein